MPGAFVTHEYADAATLLAVDPDTVGYPVGTRARATNSGLEWEVTGADGSRVWTEVGARGTSTDETVTTTSGVLVVSGSLWGLTSTGRPYYDADRAAIDEDARFQLDSDGRPSLVHI